MRRSAAVYFVPSLLSLTSLPMVGLLEVFHKVQFLPSADKYAGTQTVFLVLSCCLCTLIFGAGWYTSEGNRTDLAFLSSAFLAVGLLDLGYLLSSVDIPRFVTGSGSDKALFFGLAGRYVDALALLAIALVPLNVTRSNRQRFALLGVGLVFVIIVYGVTLFWPKLVRPLFIPGQGFTPLKVGAEYGVVVLHLTTVWALLATRRRHVFDAAPLIAAVGMMAASEIAFSLDRTGFNLYNITGNVLGLIALVFVYRAFFIEVVKEPARRRAQSKATLDKSQEYFDMMQRIAGVGSSIDDVVTGDVVWSEEVYRLTGLDPAKPPSIAGFNEVVHPDDSAALAEAAERGRKGESSDPVRFRVIAPDGSFLWFLRKHDFLRDPRGFPTHMIATMYDITAFMSFEEQLRLSQQHMARAQSISHVGSIETHFATGRSIWSDELYRILGLDAAKVPPDFATLLEAIQPEDRNRVAEARRHDLEGIPTDPSEFRVVRPDGEVRWLSCRSEQMRHTDGTRIALTVTLQDMTEYIKMTEALRESEEKLRTLAGALLTAQEEERRNLARELHDDVTQRLAFLSG